MLRFSEFIKESKIDKKQQKKNVVDEKSIEDKSNNDKNAYLPIVKG